MLLTDILTVVQVQLSHIKLFHSTCAEIRMQLAKVVIASVLVFAACTEGLPEDKGLCAEMCSHVQVQILPGSTPWRAVMLRM